MIVKLICMMIVWAGVIVIFDARNLTKRFFGFGDQNEGTSGLKILGFMIVIVNAIILMVLK